MDDGEDDDDDDDVMLVVSSTKVDGLFVCVCELKSKYAEKSHKSNEGETLQKILWEGVTKSRVIITIKDFVVKVIVMRRKYKRELDTLWDIKSPVKIYGKNQAETEEHKLLQTLKADVCN